MWDGQRMACAHHSTNRFMYEYVHKYGSRIGGVTNSSLGLTPANSGGWMGTLPQYFSGCENETPLASFRADHHGDIWWIFRHSVWEGIGRKSAGLAASMLFRLRRLLGFRVGVSIDVGIPDLLDVYRLWLLIVEARREVSMKGTLIHPSHRLFCVVRSIEQHDHHVRGLRYIPNS